MNRKELERLRLQLQRAALQIEEDLLTPGNTLTDPVVVQLDNLAADIQHCTKSHWADQRRR